MSKSFLEAHVPDLVKKLKVEEKVALLSAPNWWNTTPVVRLGIPSIRMSDGPNVGPSQIFVLPRLISVRAFAVLLISCPPRLSACPYARVLSSRFCARSVMPAI